MSKEETQAPEPEASEAPIEETAAAPESVLDGDKFLKEMLAVAVAPPVKVAVLCQGKEFEFLIGKVGPGEVTEVLRGEWRRSGLGADAQMKFDALATVDRALCVAIQKGVVKDDKGTPLWEPANVVHMYQGPDQKKFTELFTALYAHVISENFILAPWANTTAQARTITWY